MLRKMHAHDTATLMFIHLHPSHVNSETSLIPHPLQAHLIKSSRFSMLSPLRCARVNRETLSIPYFLRVRDAHTLTSHTPSLYPCETVNFDSIPHVSVRGRVSRISPPHCLSTTTVV
jgi:hypothetical protein